MKMWSLASLSVALFISNSFSQTVSFPVHIGDRWQYIVDDEASWVAAREIIGQSTMWNGKTYAILEDRSSNLLIHEYYRQDGERVYQYFAYDSTEILLYDFGRLAGDTIRIDPSGDITRISHVYIDTVLGTLRKVYRFQTVHISGLFRQEDWIADSLGLIYRIIDPPYWYAIRGAVINGISYGLITSVYQSNDFNSSSIHLHQNYPNPFNPFTTISYELPERSLVVLKVFNILGQEIRTLVNGVQDAGEKIVRFDALNMPSGMYVYRMTATTAHRTLSQSRSMLVLK